MIPSELSSEVSEVSSSAVLLLSIGGMLLLGLFTTTLAEKTFLPRVTLLLLFGAFIGPQGFDLLPMVFINHFELIADFTLLMVGFLLGGKITQQSLKEYGVEVFLISIFAAVLTTLLVSVTLVLLDVVPQIAIILGCIAAATAPAAILDVVSESNSNNRFTGLLLAIVALDDIWALVLFALGLAMVKTLNGHGADAVILWSAFKDIGGALLLGSLLGWPAAHLTGRIKEGQPMLMEALGLVFICGGLALWFDVSYLIAAMVMGAWVVNMAKHHEYAFHEIEGVESAFMVVFFVLAGASLEFDALKELGVIGAGYLIARAVGKYLGARLGAQLSGSDSVTKRWMGPALLPQAGVAVGLALVAANQFPEYRQVLLSIVISSTVIFEIVGPIFTRIAIAKSR